MVAFHNVMLVQMWRREAGEVAFRTVINGGADVVQVQI